MSEEIEHIITMINQIGDYFSAEPNYKQALADSMEHVHRFWPKVMRELLAQYLQTPESREHVHPFIIEAASLRPLV